MATLGRKWLDNNPFFWVIAQIGILKVVCDYRYDLNFYKYTRKVEYEKTSRKKSYVTAKQFTEAALNNRAQWDDVQDGETSANTDYCITRLYSVLGQLNKSEKDNVVPRILFDEIYSLPHEISFVKFCVTKDLCRRLAAYLSKVRSLDIRPQDVGKEFNELFFTCKIDKMTYKEAEQFIRGSLISNRELCKSVLMGYLAEHGPFVWFRAYLRYDSMITYFFKGP